jgi:hypothetical protein
MNLVPHVARMAFVGLAFAGLPGAAFAAGITAPGNGNSITLPAVLLPSLQDSVSPLQGSSSFNMLGQKFGVENGRLDFFSMRPSDSGDFKPLLRGGLGEGGLKLQLKW